MVKILIKEKLSEGKMLNYPSLRGDNFSPFFGANYDIFYSSKVIQKRPQILQPGALSRQRGLIPQLDRRKGRYFHAERDRCDCTLKMATVFFPVCYVKSNILWRKPKAPCALYWHLKDRTLSSTAHRWRKYRP